MSKMKITLSDGAQKEYPQGISVQEIIQDINPQLAKEALGASVDGQLVDLAKKLEKDCNLAVFTFQDPEGKYVYWHSTAHIMARAVQVLFPGTKLAIGPPLDEGFYYALDKPVPFELLSIAGAYWRGIETNPMLQRIYGVSYPTKEELDDFLKRLEEAKKNDHRRLGKELELFSFQEEAGPGLVFWHPKGALIRKTIEDFMRDDLLKNGYDLVYTPHIAKLDLWNTRRHTEFYKESMYPPMTLPEA